MRPSIIESALAEPDPGWIRGFRMADPVIISYAKGLLKQFPGVPEGIIDVIPVDLVVAAILAVAARGPWPNPTCCTPLPGARNPLRYRQLVDLVQTWFSSTRSPTARTSRSSSRTGRSRAAAGCSASSARRPWPSASPSGRCRPCRCGAAKPS